MDKDRKLFSVTKKDLRVDSFCAGGPGGQNQNKRKTACRITHNDSGAVGESREHRTFEQNKKAAFRRMVASDKFQKWVRFKSAAIIKGYSDAEQLIEKMMHKKNLKVEIREDDKWTEEAS